MLLSGARYNVVGVAPPGFQGSVRGLRSDFWVPLGLYAQVIPLLAREGPLEQLRDYPWLFVDARLKPGVSKTEAQAAVRVVTQRLEEIYPSKGAKRNVRLVQAGSLPLALGTVTLLLQVLMVVVGLVLLVACSNVANLLLARSAARQKEMGIRLSVGASRARLVRQLLVESIALSMLGGVLGLGLAVAGTSAARGFQSSLPIPTAVNLSVDSRVLLFTFALSVMTGVIFGLVPALKSTKPELSSMLRMDISGFGAGRQFRLTHGLVVVQITLALVLLVGAGLFLRSLQSASSIPLGMTPTNVLLMGFDPRATGYSNEKSAFFFRQLLERVRALPNVESAALVDTLPLSVLPHSVGVTRPGKPMLNADIYGATPRYFETMGIELVRGRDFDDRGQGALMPAVINETVTRRLYGNEDPIGKTVLMEGSEREVIGVIRDTKSRTLGEESQPQIYLSLNSEYGLFWALFGVDLAVKTRGNPNDMIANVRRQIGDLEPAMAVYNIKTMRDHVNLAMLIPRICVSLFGIFGACGLSLATLGLYGLMNYSVRRRTKELAIRMAIGATPGRFAGMVARQGLVLITVALAIGLALAYSAARILAGFLYGVSAHDVATFVWVPALMAGVAVVAVIIPARRAAKVDVIQSIRYE